jgi:hypothetical protein
MHQLGTSRGGVKDNIKIYLQFEGGIECTDLVLDRDTWRGAVNAVMHFSVAQKAKRQVIS